MKILKIGLAVLVPVILLVVIGGFLLSLSGVDPVTATKNLLTGSHNSEQSNTGPDSSQMEKMKKTISDQNDTIRRLQNDSQKKNDQIAQLNNELNQAQHNADQEGSSQEEAARRAVYAQTYKNMDPAKASAIFEKLKTNQAAEYLNMLDNKTKAAILENMAPDKAAALTPLLKPLQEPEPSSESGTATTNSTVPNP
jgi:flagellar motility protein MotE (MotC chaperone)